MTTPRISRSATAWLLVALAGSALTACESVPHDRRHDSYGAPGPSGYIYTVPPVVYPAAPGYDRDDHWRAREQRREYDRQRAEEARREREREQARAEQERRERAERQQPQRYRLRRLRRDRSPCRAA